MFIYKQSLKIILALCGATTLLIGLMVILVYGFGDEQLDAVPIKSVSIDSRREQIGSVDLGRLPDMPDRGFVTPYEGYQDRQQVAMARELLEIYESVASKQTELLSMGIDKKDILYFIIGTHLTESDTYNGQPGAPSRTYIPKTMIEWDDYGRARTTKGEIMTFKTYGVEDFTVRFIEDRKKAGLNASGPPFSNPGTSSQTGYRAGFRTGQRSVTGAVGPYQHQPTSYKSSSLITGNRTMNNPDFITDPIAYSLEGPSGRGKAYIDGQPPDIFNFRDATMTTANWLKGTVEANNAIFKRANINLKQNPEVIPFMAGGSYLMGDGGYASRAINDTSKLIDVFNNIARDEESYQKVFNLYKESFGHGTSERALHMEILEKHGVQRASTGSNPTWNFKVYEWNHQTRTYYKGRAWYELLNGVAYGAEFGGVDNQPGTITPRPHSDDRGRVIYNYMTEQSPRRTTNRSTIQGSKDNYNAVGYKGPFPIFNQNIPFNSNYYMARNIKYLHYSCTFYASVSGAYGIGLTDRVVGWDWDYRNNSSQGDGFTTPQEFWSHAHTASSSRYNPTVNPNFGLANIAGGVSTAGYQVSVYPTSRENYARMVRDLEAGLPVHARVNKNRNKITAIPTKTPINELNYLEHSMYDLDAYDWNNPKKYTLANIGHSVIVVDILTHPSTGRKYVSIVDSAYHDMRDYDSNILWWDAEELLISNYHAGYTIHGAIDGQNLNPMSTMDRVATIGSSSNPITRLVGEDPLVAVGTIEGLRMSDNDEYSLKLENTTGAEQTATIKGGYQTFIRTSPSGLSRLYIVTGRIGDTIYAIEITGADGLIQNPVSSTRELTEIFSLNSGNTAFARVGYFNENDNFVSSIIIDN